MRGSIEVMMVLILLSLASVITWPFIWMPRCVLRASPFTLHLHPHLFLFILNANANAGKCLAQACISYTIYG